MLPTTFTSRSSKKIGNASAKNDFSLILIPPPKNNKYLKNLQCILYQINKKIQKIKKF